MIRGGVEGQRSLGSFVWPDSFGRRYGLHDTDVPVAHPKVFLDRFMTTQSRSVHESTHHSPH